MEAVKNKIIFDKNQSTALKGIAILLMMLHHNFRDVSLFEDYTVSFFPFPQWWIVNAADLSKICVSLFAFITGYGLYLSYKKKAIAPGKWVLIRYIKTFSGYWLIWILSGVITQLINGRFVKVYFKKDIWTGLLHMILDFAGVAKLFETSTLNGTWWYMSAAFVFIVIMPLLVKCEKFWVVFILCNASVLRVYAYLKTDGSFNGEQIVWAFLTIYILGMVFAKYNLLERIVNADRKWIRFGAECILLAVSYKAYQAVDITRYWEVHYALIPMVAILFSVEFVMQIPGCRQILLYLGKHSMNIFMVHTFIRHYYLKDFTYSWKHFLLIILVLLLISLAISIAIEWIKKVTKYDVYVDCLCNNICINKTKKEN